MATDGANGRSSHQISISGKGGPGSSAICSLTNGNNDHDSDVGSEEEMEHVRKEGVVVKYFMTSNITQVFRYDTYKLLAELMQLIKLNTVTIRMCVVATI